MFDRRSRRYSRRFAHSLIRSALMLTTIGVVSNLYLLTSPSQAQSTPNSTWSVTIVFPPKLIAGQPATLAVFGADGRLASGVTVEAGRDQRVTTDATGRATFTAPSEGSFLLVKSSGTASAALLDATAPEGVSRTINIDPVISLMDRFSICGGGFRGDADANRVKINGERALILAASPECLVVLPGPKSSPGPSIIAVQTADIQRTAATTLVSLEFDSPQPALMPGKRSKLIVRAKGVNQPLRILVENQTPGVLRFIRGDVQELRTSGGENNFAEIEAQAIRSGDFSFHARLVPSPDLPNAQRYLQAAEGLAAKDVQHRLRGLVERLARRPKDSEKVQRQLDQIISATIAGDLRTLLEAAASSL